MIKCAGVYLSLNGTVIANNSYVDIDSIGSDDNGALICHTDCRILPNETAEGNWYYPNGTVVEMADNRMADNISVSFISSRGQREIRLLHIVNSCLTTDSEGLGIFYCMVTDTYDASQILYINICELHLISLAFIYKTSSEIQ